MPSLSTVRTSNASYSFPSTSTPIAIFVGGTSGIGQATAQAFAKHTKGNARIIIIGRNRSAAEATFASFPKHQNSKYEFVECDVSLLKNIGEVTQKLVKELPKLNYLAITSGALPSPSINLTSEGLPSKVVLNYYSRWLLTKSLLPLLQAAKEAGEDAKVLTVLAAGNGGPIADMEDLDLLKSYSLGTLMNNTTTYNDLMIESFASQNPSMSFTHTYPGFVRTSIFVNSSWILKLLSPVILAATYFFSYSAADSGEYMLYSLLNKENEKGAWRRGPTGDVLGEGKGYWSNDDARKRVWEHTTEVVAQRV